MLNNLTKVNQLIDGLVMLRAENMGEKEKCNLIVIKEKHN